jgi:hypothetical protein
MGRSNQPQDVFRQIDTHNNDPTVCWEWTGSTGGRDNRGYFSLNGKKVQSHRLVYELVNGPIEGKLVVRHTCDNPICCNPKHLILGTRGQNEKDKYERDRAGYTHDMIKEMKRLHKMSMTYEGIAVAVNSKFGTQISASGVGKIIRGERRTGE